MAEALVATGKHTVTALTRPDSTSPIPAGVKSVTVDYTDKESLVAALRGQDALIITLAVTSPRETHSTLVEAAAAAGVPWILPNAWGVDSTSVIDATLAEDVPGFGVQPVQREHIASLGVSSYISVSTGFWYEWSVAIPAAFGFDFASRTATFYDDGKTLLSLSTWPQVGRAIVTLFSLPVEKEEGSELCLADFRNKLIYIASFTTSQAEILESILRVTGDKREDWKIEYETSWERFEQGREAMKQGDRLGFARLLYARSMYPVPGVANTEKTHGLTNEMLGLQKEDLDEATKLAIERAKTTKPYGSA